MEDGPVRFLREGYLSGWVAALSRKAALFLLTRQQARLDLINTLLIVVHLIFIGQVLEQCTRCHLQVAHLLEMTLRDKVGRRSMVLAAMAIDFRL